MPIGANDSRVTLYPTLDPQPPAAWLGSAFRGQSFTAYDCSLQQADEAPDPPGRIRVLSPFDPMLRDRKRTERLFGFHYRIEVFVPEAKRQYGYYVFPLLEGDRLIGRIDMKCRRDPGTLTVSSLWLEPKIKPTKGRLQKLEAELERLGRFSDCRTVCFEDGWLKT